jgi:starch-binding outer membrane protein, SusD/RagB family
MKPTYFRNTTELANSAKLNIIKTKSGACGVHHPTKINFVMMKLKYAIFILLAFSANSCQKFIQEDLHGVYSSATFYKTQGQALMAINAAYNDLLFNSTDNYIWVFGDVASDDAVKGSLAGDQIEIQYIDQFNVVSSNPVLLSAWMRYYDGITRANIVLKQVPAISMDENLKTRILGEAKFIRAYMYFNLVNIFGSIPLKLNPPLTQADINVPKSSVETIYTRIEKDLEEAAAVLPAVNSSPDLGRATMGASLGLLAKAYLYQGKYEEVLRTVKSIDSLGIYSLMPLFRANFQAATQSNQESLFEIHHMRGQNPGLGNGLNQYFSPRGDSVYQGYAFDAPTQNFVSEFEITSDNVVDPRLDYSVGRPGQKWINGEDFNSSWSPTTYVNKKHAQPFSEIPDAYSDGNLSYVYLRYADILLMKAEALNELSRSAEALVPLNQVRKRARESYLYDNNLAGFGTIPDNLLPDITTTVQQDVQTAIRHERRVELGLEFHRFFDLVRYGKQASEAALSGTNFNFDTNHYFPVPLSEQDNNPNLNN